MCGRQAPDWVETPEVGAAMGNALNSIRKSGLAPG
jgi:hypothetical protein